MNCDCLLLSLHRHEGYLESCTKLLNEEWPRSQAARLRSLCESCDDLPISLVLLDEDKQLIGHCWLSKVSHQQDACYISSVIVPKLLRGRGHGRKIMKQAEQFAAKNNFRKMYLMTQDKQRFYERLGYTYCEPIQAQVAGVSSKIQSKIEMLFSANKSTEEQHETSNPVVPSSSNHKHVVCSIHNEKLTCKSQTKCDFMSGGDWNCKVSHTNRCISETLHTDSDEQHQRTKVKHSSTNFECVKNNEEQSNVQPSQSSMGLCEKNVNSLDAKVEPLKANLKSLNINMKHSETNIGTLHSESESSEDETVSLRLDQPSHIETSGDVDPSKPKDLMNCSAEKTMSDRKNIVPPPPVLPPPPPPLLPPPNIVNVNDKLYEISSKGDTRSWMMKYI